MYPTTIVEALLRERDFYEAEGDPSRVAAVDDQLAHYNVAVDGKVPKPASVKDVLATVGDDPVLAAEALEAEEAQAKPRKSLVEQLEAIIAAVDADEGEDDGEGD